MDIGLLVVIIHTIAYTVKRMDDGVERGHRSAFMGCSMQLDSGLTHNEEDEMDRAQPTMTSLVH